MWRNVLILMLTLRMLMGSAVCCCTLGAWMTSLSGKSASTSCCCCPQPTNESSQDSSPGLPVRHQCPCRCGLNVIATTASELFNFESLRIASWLDKLELSTAFAACFPDRDLNRVMFPADSTAGPFAHCRGTEILRLLQTMRC